jgi:4'-phosphopantetheinyl transferase EntD
MAVSSGRLDERLPACCGLAGGPVALAQAPLYASERSAIRNAHPARRVEFTAGRTYARQAMAAVGAHPGPIPRGAGRAPVWPPALVGSISHSAGQCLAVVAPRDRIGALGVDLELRPRLSERLLSVIAHPAEIAAPRPAGWADPQRLGVLLFAIREAVYKAYSPATGVYLRYTDVEITLDWECLDFRAQLTEKRPPLHGLRTVSGIFWTCDEGVQAAAWVPACKTA